MKHLPLLYHVAPKRFDTPDVDRCLDFLLTSGEPIHKSPNGAMGLWVSPFPGSCSAFGPECATLQIKPTAKLMGMELSHLYTLYKTLSNEDVLYSEQVLAHYRYGRQLAEHADVLCIIDRYNHFGEVIVLNVDVITDWQWQDNFNFKSTKEQSTSLGDFNVALVPPWFFDAKGNIFEDVDFKLERY